MDVTILNGVPSGKGWAEALIANTATATESTVRIDPRKKDFQGFTELSSTLDPIRGR
ncbi:MAG: hypothetical protein IPH05_16075 [Flavobacteriales bacterium]|nr:hypothetical protein [Flavobacteriales bacterium]MBK6548981.1 hypothetical protein [Flavobacteriales bacterium]MBK6884425.1 hypothetical protein [Flavobacteriales bacterium]MBK7100822.1 hypothetical protein [Flavobacteriales bacterium]MBK7111509.1 hypothetical protein [Flavobacteriales bacterium]